MIKYGDNIWIPFKIEFTNIEGELVNRVNCNDQYDWNDIKGNPYGDNYKDFCQADYTDENGKLLNIFSGDIIFASNKSIEEFFKENHMKI